MHMNLLKSILHNIGVVAIGFLFALVGVGIDGLLGIASFQSLFALVLGSALLAIGFLLRVWATYHFYRRQMNVIVLSAQTYLIMDGPYRFSRNPLYLGGLYLLGRFSGPWYPRRNCTHRRPLAAHGAYGEARRAATRSGVWGRMAAVQRASAKVDLNLR